MKRKWNLRIDSHDVTFCDFNDKQLALVEYLLKSLEIDYIVTSNIFSVKNGKTKYFS